MLASFFFRKFLNLFMELFRPINQPNNSASNERGILSLRSRLRSIPNAEYAPTNPIQGSHPYAKKAPDHLVMGAFFDVILNGERGILSLRSRLRSSPNADYAPTNPIQGSHPCAKKSPRSLCDGSFLRCDTQRRERDSNPRTAYAV